MEAKYIQTLTQDMIDLKYMTILNKHKINGKAQSLQQRVCGKVYISSLSLL